MLLYHSSPTQKNIKTMPKFEKGHAPVGGGRKKGSLNKSREPIRQMFAEYVLGDFKAYTDAMAKLKKNDPAAYVRAFNDAVKHVLPALQSIELTAPSESRDTLAEYVNNLAIEAEPKPDQKE
jgi:hypothetical protein